jgi:hypothetical protein
MRKLLLFTCLFGRLFQMLGDTPVLKNEDILKLHASGLTDAIIKAKIQTTPCNFDTTPEALRTLKDAGIEESVILEMIDCKGSPPVPMPSKLSNTAGTPAPSGYELTFIKSDRKWKYGLRSEPFNKISEYADKQLTAALETKGVHRMPVIATGCCRVVLELLEVTTHPAVIKKPGIDTSANISVRDTNDRLVYSKGYRGESRTLGNTWGHLINHAVEDLVSNIAADPDLIKALATGNPN